VTNGDTNGSSGNSVTVIAESTETVTHTISLGCTCASINPVAVAVDAKTNTVYTANYSGNTVSVINGKTNAVKDTVTVGGANPEGVTVDPSTDTVEVADFAQATVSVIDGSINTVTATVGVGTYPSSVAVDATTGTGYIANYGSGTVSVINAAPASYTVTTVGLGSNPQGVAIYDSTDTVYAANETVNSETGTVSVIDGATNKVTATIGVGVSPTALAVDPTTNTVYVVNSGTDAGVADTVFTANPQNSGTVSEIDGATNLATGTFDVGSFPVSVATDDTTDTVDVTNYNSDTLSAFSPTFATLPGAPTIGTATAGQGQASVAFSAPSNNGGWRSGLTPSRPPT
jgi:YVTN family beta-propeller protein